MGQGMTWMFAQFIYLFFAHNIVLIHGTIFVISEETNETVRVIYEKNIRAVSDAVEGYVVISNPLNACEPVEPAPIRKNSARLIGDNSSTEDPVFAFDEDGRVERDWVLLSIVYDCDVTTKARNAQLGGYKALIIQNIGSNDSQHIPWHILRFPLVKLNHVLVGEYDGDLLRLNFSYPNNRFYVKFEEDKFYQLMCYILIGIIIVLLSTMFALFWFQICCAIIIVLPHQVRQLLQRWLHPGKRRLTRPMLQLIPVKKWVSTDPFQACAICQEDFKERDELRLLPCQHGFHAICVDPWLLRRSRRCPCCMQRVRLPNDKSDEEDEENENDDNYLSSRVATSYARSSQDLEAPPLVNGGRMEPTVNPTDSVDDPLLSEVAQQSPQKRLNSALSNLKSDSSQESCAITSRSESTRSSQEGKTLDWQLRRFLQSFNYNPPEIAGGSEKTASRQSQHRLAKTPETGSINPISATSKSLANATTSGNNEYGGSAKLLETILDAPQSCSTDARNSTLEVHVGTVMTEDGSYHLSSPYPASNSTFTISTTRDRKTSDATTISGSLPRDESSFHNAEEIHSEIISEEIFDEAVSSVSALSDQDTTTQADKE